MIEDNKNIKVREWQGWSYNNICNHTDIKEGAGCVLFVSKEDINEMEIVGLYHLLKYKAKIYNGLDVEFIIANGYYNSKLDYIYEDKMNLTIKKVSKRCPTTEVLETLKNAKDIICVYYIGEPRYNKSRWWKFRNKKIAKVINLAIENI